MQSRLPDINTAFNTHRKRAIISLENHNHTECLGALYALNALLPQEYRVIISELKYAEVVRQDQTISCLKCGHKTDYSKVRIANVITTPLQRMLSNQKSVRIWFCLQCKYENILTDTTIEKTILSQPYYLGVIQPPPQRRDGIIDRINYDRLFQRWAWTMLDELEEKMAQYRDDNWNRGDDDYDISMQNMDTSWEEKD